MKSIKLIKTIFLYLFVLNLWGQNYQNFLGSVGSFYTPTARFHEEGSLSLSIARDELFSRGNLLAQPYDWLEVSIFYADIPNKSYSASLGQSYKDKGFNAKILVGKENKFTPQIAIGLSDFAGTGLFAGEYIVGSKKIQNFDLSLGMGWGVYGGFETFKNPFRYLDSKYKERNYNYDNVGELDEDDYFSGDRASLFASLAYTKDFGTLVAEFSELTLSQNRFGSSKKAPSSTLDIKATS